MGRKRAINETESGPPLIAKTAEDALKVFKEQTGQKDRKIITTTVTSNLTSVWNTDRETLERVQSTVSWVSHLKAKASVFGNWLISYRLHHNQQLPRLTESFFTDLFVAVTSRPQPKRSKTSDLPTYSAEYSIYEQQTGASQLEWMMGNAQILSHAKNEMTTVASTFLNPSNFTRRRTSILKWKIVDILSAHLHQTEKKGQAALVYKVLKRALSGSTTWEELSLPVECEARLTEMVKDDQARLESLRSSIALRNRDHFISSEATRLEKRQNDRVEKEKNKAVRTSESTPAVPLTARPVEVLSAEQLKAIAATKFDSFTLGALIKIDPLLCTAYFHGHLCDVRALPLTEQWNDALRATTKDQYKALWPWWKGLKFPYFSPLPVNKLSRQFVRIDPRTLKEWSIEQVPDKWWLTSLVDIYKSDGGQRGRIRPFRAWYFLDSPQTAVQHFINDDCYTKDDRPMLPGQSFTTDGVSVHFVVSTLSSPHDNLEGLFEKGYSGIKILRAPVPLSGAKGVQQLKSVTLLPPHNVVDPDTQFIGIDPGLDKPVAFARLKAEDWTPDQREAVVNKTMQNSGFYTTEDLLRATGRNRFRDLEKRRRHLNGNYGRGSSLFQGTTKRTYDLEKLTAYAQVRATSDQLRLSELMSLHRSIQRRIRFRLIQRNISNIVHKVSGEPSRVERRRMSKRGERYVAPKYVFFFGSALFKTTKGRVSIPRKAVIRALLRLGVVVLTNEFNTSKLCPYDFQVLNDRKDQERVRQCPTDHTNSGAPFTCDRDIIGSVNINQKSLYQISGRPISGFYPGNDETDVSDDEEEEEEQEDD